jgi:hypothetical protein
MNQQNQVYNNGTKHKLPLTINIPIPTPLHNQNAETSSNNDTITQQPDIPESSNNRNKNHTQKPIPRSFLYSDQEINEGLSACSHSFLGKIITDKPIYVSSIQNGLESIWGAPAGLKVQEIGGKILQFFISDPADKERILLGNPWIFRNSWLVVKPWEREIDPHTIDFENVPIWIQLWGLPPHCKTKQMGVSIGALLGQVEASEFYEYPGEKVIIKIKVALNIHNPITSGIHVGNPRDGTSWIDFRYEKLPQVCFNCGMIGHMDKLCKNQALDLETLAPLGPWIRSNQYGRRKMEEKDKKFYSNPSKASNFGQYSPPVPSDLIEKLAAMKMSATSEPQTGQHQYQQATQATSIREYVTGPASQTLQMETQKKTHGLHYSSEAMQVEANTDPNPSNKPAQVKRQKVSEIPRVGSAKQASPQP